VDRRDKLRLGVESIELLGGKDHRRCLAVLRDYERAPVRAKVTDPLGKMRFQLCDRHDILGDL
jgi:hypothetical protein